MKVCRECGVEIINGINGCQITGDICFKCRGGFPDYSKLPKVEPVSTWEEADYWESMCLSMGEPVD